MAFLDNSGDIILDAVLTDEGRKRLAKGDGSFNIVKFALGDDEIDYGLYNGSNASGSAYYDLDLLQTPILEAFTNNVASMNSKLITIPRTDLLFLPILKLNEISDAKKRSIISGYEDSFFVTINSSSVNGETDSRFKAVAGYARGVLTLDSNYIQVDQGLDTTAISYAQTIPSDLNETQFEVKIDNRLGVITAFNNINNQAIFSSIDDDQVATYTFTAGQDDIYVSNIDNKTKAAGVSDQNETVIAGPRGTKLNLRISPSINLITNNYLFNLLGSSGVVLNGLSGTFKIIRSVIRISGVNTGYEIDIPVIFVKAE